MWVSWDEIRRLALTYGYPAALTSDLLERLGGADVPVLGPVVVEPGVTVGADNYERLDLPVVHHIRYPAPRTAPAAEEPNADRPPLWPLATIYGIPQNPRPSPSLPAEQDAARGDR